MLEQLKKYTKTTASSRPPARRVCTSLRITCLLYAAGRLNSPINSPPRPRALQTLKSPNLLKCFLGAGCLLQEEPNSVVTESTCTCAGLNPEWSEGKERKKHFGNVCLLGNRHPTPHTTNFFDETPTTLTSCISPITRSQACLRSPFYPTRTTEGSTTNRQNPMRLYIRRW